MLTALAFLVSILGTWQYAGFRFEGKEYPPPNPDLIVEFTYYEDHTYRYYWNRKNEDVTCELRGIYELKLDLLWQKVTWLNPENGRACSLDPDMQVNKESTTHVTLQVDELALNLDLNGKPFVYVLKRVPHSAGSSSLPVTNPYSRSLR